MADDDFTCNICSSKIIVYFHDKYDGKRGKCLTCGIDFPLE